MVDESTHADGMDAGANGQAPSSKRDVMSKVAAAISEEAASTVTVEEHLTPKQLGNVDVRQDELMAASSSDGRPPQHWLRRTEWRWFRIAVIGVLLISLVWMIAAGVERNTVAMAGVLILIMVFAAAPVWGAALLRGSEERAARARAVNELLLSSIDSNGNVLPGRNGSKTASGVQIVCVKEDSNV